MRQPPACAVSSTHALNVAPQPRHLRCKRTAFEQQARDKVRVEASSRTYDLLRAPLAQRGVARSAARACRGAACKRHARRGGALRVASLTTKTATVLTTCQPAARVWHAMPDLLGQTDTFTPRNGQERVVRPALKMRLYCAFLTRKSRTGTGANTGTGTSSSVVTRKHGHGLGGAHAELGVLFCRISVLSLATHSPRAQSRAGMHLARACGACRLVMTTNVCRS